MEITIDKDYKIWAHESHPSSPLFLWHICDQIDCRWGLTTEGYTMNYTWNAKHRLPPKEITNKLKFILPKFPGHHTGWFLAQALVVKDLSE